MLYYCFIGKNAQLVKKVHTNILWYYYKVERISKIYKKPFRHLPFRSNLPWSRTENHVGEVGYFISFWDAFDFRASPGTQFITKLIHMYIIKHMCNTWDTCSWKEQLESFKLKSLKLASFFWSWKVSLKLESVPFQLQPELSKINISNFISDQL